MSFANQFVKTSGAGEAFLEGSEKTLQGWFLWPVLILFRMAAGFPFVLPFMVIMVLLVRGFIATPATSASGHPDFEVFIAGLAANPKFMIGITGLFTIVYVIQFIVLTLADAGLFGEMADSMREKRAPLLGGFFENAVKLFGRFAALKLLFDIPAILLGFAFNIIFYSAHLMIKPDISGTYTIGMDVLVLFSAAFLCFSIYSFIGLWATASFAALSAEDCTIGNALRFGIMHMKRAIRAMIALYAFFLVLSTIWLTVSTGGSFFWMEIQQLKPHLSWPIAAGSAWDISFGLLQIILWFLVICTQIALYVKSGCYISKVRKRGNENLNINSKRDVTPSDVGTFINYLEITNGNPQDR